MSSIVDTDEASNSDVLGDLPAPTSNPAASLASVSNRRASSRLRQVLGNETSYEAIMKYMRLSKGKNVGSKFSSLRAGERGDQKFDDGASDAGSVASTASATTRSHANAINKLNASISTFTRRAQRELVPRIERLTNTNSNTIKLAKELEETLEDELKASCQWEAQRGREEENSDERAFEIELFKTLCKSIWKSEGRDAVLTYAVEAIEEVEVDIEEDFEDEEELLPPDDLVELEET